MKPSINKNILLRHRAVHEVDLTMDRQVCVIKTVAYRSRTDRHTDTCTDRQKVKTEGPKILSNYTFYFKTVIIGGQINMVSIL